MPLTYRSRAWRMRSRCKRIVNGILWEMSVHKLRTESRRIFKLGRGVDDVTCHISPLTEVKRSQVKVTRSRNVSLAMTLLRTKFE